MKSDYNDDPWTRHPIIRDYDDSVIIRLCDVFRNLHPDLDLRYKDVVILRDVHKFIAFKKWQFKLSINR